MKLRIFQQTKMETRIKDKQNGEELNKLEKHHKFHNDKVWIWHTVLGAMDSFKIIDKIRDNSLLLFCMKNTMILVLTFPYFFTFFDKVWKRWCIILKLHNILTLLLMSHTSFYKKPHFTHITLTIEQIQLFLAVNVSFSQVKWKYFETDS